MRTDCNGRVKVYKTWYDAAKTIPYKWRADCTCGTHIMSWQWVRPVEEGGGGALFWALAHVGLVKEQDL